MSDPLESPPPMSEHEAYEHILRSFASAWGVLLESMHEIDDLQLDAARNTREVNLLLNWMWQTQEEIYEKVPELRPPPNRREPRWERQKDSDEHERYTREQALWQLWHHLRLVSLILRESGPFTTQVGLRDPGLFEQLEAVGKIHEAVFRQIWGEMSDRERRQWMREHEMPQGLLEPPPVDRDTALVRLNEKLETASQVLDASAGLVVELKIGSERVRAIGNCLATIFDIQQQIYSERPDLMPDFLKP